MKWVGENWATIAMAIAVVIQVIQVSTAHAYAQGSKGAKVIQVIVSILSVLKSKDVEGIFKLPLTVDRPKLADGKSS